MKSKTTKAKSQSSNELYAIHFRGELLQPDIWKKYSDRYGSLGLYGWRPPKKIYHKLHHARTALRQLPKEIQDDCAIVRYIPGEVVEHSKDTIEAYKKRQAKKQEQYLKRIEEAKQFRINVLRQELEQLVNDEQD